MLLMDTSPEPRTVSQTHHCFPITSWEGEAHHLGGGNRDLKTGPETVQVTTPKLPMIKCTGQLKWFDSGYCNKENVPYWGKCQRRERKLGVLLRVSLKKGRGGLISGYGRVGWSFVFSEYKRITKGGRFFCFLGVQGSAEVQHCPNCSFLFYF